MKKICVLLVCLVLAMASSGCTTRQELVGDFKEVSNIKKMSGGYFHYDIENGKVTCREHSHRYELTCWNKVLE